MNVFAVFSFHSLY